MVPDGWQKKTVGELCEFSNGNGFSAGDWSESGLPIIRIQNLNGSREFNYFAGEAQEKWIVEPGQLLFAWAGTKGVSFGPTVWDGPRGVLNQHIYRLAPRPGVEQDWLYPILRRVTDKVEAKAHGFKSTLVHVHKRDITDVSVPVPPVSEQRAIADTLSVWNSAIDTCLRLLESATQQKKALSQQLLTGKRRLPGFADAWRHLHLGDVCERVTRKNAAGVDNVLTISAQHGLVSQQDYFNKPVASSDLSTYTHLKRGDFAYNKSYSKGFPMGAIKELSLYDEGVVSSLYICFRRKRHGLGEQAFLRHFIESGMLNREIYAFAQEGARNHGLLNIAVGDFLSCRLNLPGRDEQLAIAAALDLADQCVEGHKKQLELLEKEKRALMQQLLTGKRRIKLPHKHTTPTKEHAS
ncbi:MAG TPA: restriction endonuclease subunit S [Gammaproteobacteria bacterium]|nr:restriction endonuclease subunit S [Gammaproteobacteria bacterium]